MNELFRKPIWILVYVTVLAIVILCLTFGNDAVTVMAEHTPLQRENCVIIDAGHGGIDGGAVSCTGVNESNINLQIALRLDDLMHLLGIDTKMIRTTDISVYTSGQSIGAKKASDLKERVRIVNETDNGILLSIHQNHYSDSRYNGAQMFYTSTDGSVELAQHLQTRICQAIQPDNTRQIKRAEGIYLMEHVQRPAVLVECGFLSNPEEEALLRDAAYQKKLCCVIAVACIDFITVKDTAS